MTIPASTKNVKAGFASYIFIGMIAICLICAAIGTISNFFKQLSPTNPSPTISPTLPVKSQTSTPYPPSKSIIPPPSLTATTTPALNAFTDPCISTQVPQIGQVVEVVDGDTIRVIIDGIIYPVRYIGMDTPETTTQQEPFGKEASTKNAELVDQQEVTLYRDKSETDRYNRLLRYVFVGSTFVNRELVSTGLATAKDYPPDIACSATFHAAELDARDALVGMWAVSAALAPTTRANVLPTVPASAPSEAGASLTIIEVNKQAEYVIIRNDGSEQVDLSGWILLSEKGNQSCALGGTIDPGATLQIWAQTGDGFSCNFSKTIWNNSEADPAVLINPQGQEISRK